jgi:GT2 family glycosyltransferase
VTTTPDISIVIPTYNRRSRLARVLGALECQTYPIARFEVVVVSDGSTDGTDDYLADARPGYELVVATQPNAGPAAARNLGVELARAPIVLFVDDDVVAAPDLVEQHLASHAATESDAVVIGPMLNPPDFEMRPWVRWEQASLYKQYDAMNAGHYEAGRRQFYTGNASLPRARFVAAGGFDTRFRRAEDVELSHRLDEAGLQFVWSANAVGYHYADRSFDSWLAAARAYGVNDVVFCRDERHDPLFDRVCWEFRGHKWPMRWLIHACVAMPVLERVIGPPLRLLGTAGDRVGAEKVSRVAFSVLFNVAYYRGIATALGSRAEFERMLVGRAAPGGPDPARR